MSILNLQDGLQRMQATDPKHSYIVQAPAGSGKTEILTQRYLRLLTTVQSPEQIVALTFTRKAANEMRERIVLALQRAANQEPPKSEHQRTTQDYATEALKRDKLLGWQILQQPSRLRVITIDSLCQILSRSIPLNGQSIHYANLCDKPKPYYLETARSCFRFAMEEYKYQPALKTLLLHLDNRQDKLIHLFCDLLMNREQWIALIFQAKTQDKATFEQAIAWIEQHELSRFQETFPAHLTDELISSVRFLSNLTTRSERLSQWYSLDELDRELSKELANLLLTSQQKLRRAFDHHVGLRRGSCPDEIYDKLKQQSKLLLNALAEQPDFIEGLIRVRDLPAPYYEPNQWRVLQALFQLLPLLLAHLNMLFTEHNIVDFTCIAQQALLGLGDTEEPTDLALYLDHQIQHLLVDEFQDTSIQQFQLLTQLVQGWEPNDGRTLFIVGDPMQSIYRFRSAEVGLFMRAQEAGIGPIKLKCLAFTCNFRSTATLVHWVNQQFQHIFPHKADVESGAVSFLAAIAIHQSTEHTAIEAKQWQDKSDEAQGIVETITQELTNHPNDSVAILVRSRHQLGHIIQALREKQIPFQGVDIDLLAHLPHIRDVYTLTEALLMPANRLAWLSLLRSPWCGLSLKDLHAIASFAPSQSIFWTLLQLEKISTLSADGRTRLQYMRNILSHALNHRYQLSLVDWVMDTCSKLHAASIFTPAQHEDLEQFWILLEQFEQQGQITDLSLFKQELETLYSKKVVSSKLQIMTIHKSKGLEFDCVILPGLGSKSAQRDTPLFRWLKLPTQQQDSVLLLSPLKAAEEEICLLYNYLGRVDAEKEQYEFQRLLYVAVTRAKRRLYLFDHHTTIRQNTFRDLLKTQPFVSIDQPITTTLPFEGNNILPKRHYLPEIFYQNLPESNSVHTHSSNVSLTNSLPRLIGIVAHELLCWVCTYHPTSIEGVPWCLAEQHLVRLGFSREVLQHAMRQLKQQFQTLFADPIGKWIIQKHESERNEYELLVQDGSSTMTKIIDRTFIDQGTRWIIDFKTGQNDEQSGQRYRQQVDAYASLFTSRSKSPIQCGLYYLATSEWICWTYDISDIQTQSPKTDQ